MVHPVQCVGLRCDGCGEEYMNDHSGFSWFSDAWMVREDADNGGWHNEGDKDYCPSCHHFDDEDNLVISPTTSNSQ